MRMVTRKQLEMLRKQYPAGAEVCLDHMEDDAVQIHVKWENGVSLALIPGEDRVRVLRRSDSKAKSRHPSAYMGR